MKNNKTLLAVIALVVLVAAFAAVYFLTQPEAMAGTKTITVTVVHKDGTEKVFEITTSEEKLAPALKAEGILPAEDGADGMYNTVDGETADWNEDQSYWGFYIDGEYAMTGMNDTTITDGAQYRIEYTVYVAQEDEAA